MQLNSASEQYFSPVAREHEREARVDVDLDMVNSPITRLPPEIMSYIFTACLPEDPLAPPSISDAPLLLGRISRLWRNVSISTPDLWTSFHLDLEETYTKLYPSASDKTAQLLSALDVWLSRSGSSPLSLGLSFKSTHGWVFDATDPLVKILLTCAPRCRYLSLHLGSAKERDSVDLLRYPFYRLPHASFPLLEEIDLEFPFRNAIEFLTPAFSSLPRLRKVTLTGFPPSLLTFIPPSTSGQLTYLRSNAAESVQGCCQILSLYPSLRQCRFDLHSADHMEADKHIPVIHRCLQRLYVGPTNLGLFFDSVTLPALETLSINGATSTLWDPEDEWGFGRLVFEAKPEQSSFLAFLTRSMCSLTTLSFFNVNLSSNSFIDCLEAVSPALVERHVEGGERRFIDQAVMNVLTYRRPDQPPGTLGARFFCPFLERIRIRDNIFEFGGSGRFMLDMLESRFRQPFSVEGLSRLRGAFIGGTYNDKQWERIEALESEGLELLVVEEGSKYIPHYLGDQALFE